MVRHPMEHSIAEQEVGVWLRHPGRKITVDECAARQPLAGLSQHVWRGVDPDDVRLGKPFDQQFSGIARPATEIGDTPRRAQRHLRQEIAWRARAFILELEILPGAPVRAREALIGGVGHRRDPCASGADGHKNSLGWTDEP